MSNEASTVDAEAKPPARRSLEEQTWIQDTVFGINNTVCSGMQRIASKWRDIPASDPMIVVIKLREAARAFHAIADRIEAKRNACLQLEGDKA